MTSRPAPLRAATRRLLGLVAVTGAAAVLSLVGALPAAAHNSVIGVDPADGSTQATVPAAVTVRFQEPPAVRGIAVAVTGPTGDVTVGAPTVTGSELSITVRPGSPAGDYRVAWRVVSDDGHPIQGTTRFTARAGSSAAVTPDATAPTESTAPVATATGSTAPASTPTGSTAPAAAVTQAPVTQVPVAQVPVDQVPVASADGGSERGTAVVVVLGLVVLGALAAAVVSRRRAH